VIGLLSALTLPGDITDAMVTAMMGGIGACVGEVGGKVLGGDLTRGTSLVNHGHRRGPGAACGDPARERARATASG
jgi:thiamine monophosphate kinase